MEQARRAALEDALVFSAKEATIEAGGAYEVVVPMDDSGGFIVYEYAETSDEGVHFSVRTEDGRLLLEEVQPSSKEQVRVPAGVGSVCKLTWANTEAWVSAVTVSYTVRVVSMTGIKGKLERRLRHAAEQGLVGVIQECLHAGVSVDATDATDAAGHTPLLRAALADRTTAVVALLGAGAAADASDRHGNQALHLAALVGAQPPLLQALLQGGASVDAANSEGATPLALATFRGHVEAARILLAAGADPTSTDSRGNTAIHLAAGSGHAVLATALLAAHEAPLHLRNQRGETPLQLAASGGHAEVLVGLLRAGAADLEDEAVAALSGAPQAALASALLTCCEEGRELTTLRLLDAGAPLSAMTSPAVANEGAGMHGGRGALGPLTLAARGGHTPIVSLLLRRSALRRQSELLPTDRLEALDVAASLGHSAVVDVLLQDADDSGDTGGVPTDAGTSASPGSAAKERALMMAAGAGRTGLVLVLLHGTNHGTNHGANHGTNHGAISAMSASHRGAAAAAANALHAAAAGGHTMTALALLRHGFPVESLDDQGRTAPGLALERGHEQTALTMVRAAGDSGMLQLLLARAEAVSTAEPDAPNLLKGMQ